MKFKFVTLTSHDGKRPIKFNPLRINYLVSDDDRFTKIHFGQDQTIEVSGNIDAVEAAIDQCIGNP